MDTTPITFIESDGTAHSIDAPNGTTLMQVAIDNMLPGIAGDCGGSCSCATCHAYIDAAFMDRVEPATADEADLLEGALDAQATSRLTCQIRVSPELAGLSVRIPASPY
ncbi:MAG: 2Fe-2S iron-sulfur cluster-binding protein [Burkholderiaceae bacterium]|nr:2Fe-2S iron-sulfur cluster-binding protein [Desulfobacterales bacterium]MDP3138955.1 2Fe-2S iron-sulfur cluster-binding protein [Burkholderiaceae bacterium]